MRLQPDLGDARLALAYYYYYGYRDYELARTEIAIAQRATPNDAEIWDAAGAIDRRQGRWEQAVPNFEKARQLDPRNNSVIWNLAETYACLGRYADAASMLADGAARCPDAHFFSLAHACHRSENQRRHRTAPGRVAQYPEGFRSRRLGHDRRASGEFDGPRLRGRHARLLQASRAEKYNDTGLEGPAAVLRRLYAAESLFRRSGRARARGEGRS